MSTPVMPLSMHGPCPFVHMLDTCYLKRLSMDSAIEELL